MIHPDTTDPLVLAQSLRDLADFVTEHTDVLDSPRTMQVTLHIHPEARGTAAAWTALCDALGLGPHDSAPGGTTWREHVLFPGVTVTAYAPDRLDAVRSGAS